MGVCVFGLVSFALYASASVQRTLGLPCPPDSLDIQWVWDGQSTCTTVLRASPATFATADAVCSSPDLVSDYNVLPSDTSLCTLFNSTHALAVASLIPLDVDAVWLGLAVSNLSTQWTWLGSSVYALDDPSAWYGAVVPVAGPGGCAVLERSGRLRSLDSNCTRAWQQGVFEATACSIPAWAWNVSAPLLSLYSYHLFGPEDVEWPLDVMQPPTVRQAASMSAGCGARFASQTAAARWIEALPLLPGHVLRLCGALKKLLASDDLIALSVAGGNVLGAACTYTNFTPAQCLQYFIPPLLTHTSRMLRPISGDILGAYHCMVLAQPWGKIACTRDSNTGEEMPTYGLSLQDPLGQAVKEPVVALAVSKDFACAVLAVSYGLACWGSLPRGEYIFNIVVSSVAVGLDFGCFLGSYSGDGPLGSEILLRRERVLCFGDDTAAGTAPSDLPPVAQLAAGNGNACIVARDTGLVRCWGGTDTGINLVPPDLPPAERIAVGDPDTCVILRGSRFLRCWAHRPDEFNLQSPPWVQTVPVADVCMSRVNICVLLTNSSVACWTISSQLLIPKLPSSGIVMISCATSSVCGVLANGTTVCAGITRKLDFPTDPLTVALSSNATYAHFRLPKAQVTYPTPVRAFVDGRRGWRAVSLQTLDAPDKTNSTILVEHAFVMDAPVASWQRHGIGMPAPDILTYSQDSLSGQLLSFPCDVLSNEPQREMEGPWTPSPAGSVQHACKASAYVYGITAIDWQSSQHQHLRRPGAMTLSSAFRSPSEETRFLPPPQVLDALNLTTALAQRTGSTPRQVLLVRAGDTVTVHGTGFGVDPSKSRSVPWYTMPELDNATSFAAVGAGAPNGLAQGLTPGLRRQRSCVHLAWWATLAAYHADSTCECNGLEDWLGEGEVPVSAIRAWNDTLLSFIVPLGEGIRELRLCVEGKGLVSAPRAATSIYVAWDIPFVTSASADLLGANTGNDFTGTAAEVVVDYIAVTTQPPQVLTETWGTCNARSLPPDNMGRAHYAAPLRCEHSFVLRHCSAVPALLSSVHGCFTTVSLGNGTLDVPGGRPNCTQTLMVDVGRSSDQLLQSDGSSMSPAVLAGPGSRRLLIPVPAPVPTAAFQVNFTMTVWDAGVEMSARPELRPASLFSGLPVLRSVTPNVLLLGAPRSRSGDGSRAGTGGQREPALSSTQADSAKLRLSGVGFRSVEEITNPLYGMLSYPSQLLVWLGQQHVACENASLVTAPDGSRHVDCLVPVDRIDGGEVQVLMQMAENTSLPLSALTIRCAEGSYGLFGPGHQLCLPCPLGATCREGVGLPPVASEGYYNLGFPQALDEAGVTAATAPTTSVSARVDADCPAYTDGRPLACIVACEPSQACLGANQCAQGYKSEAPMYRCAQCVDGYYRSSGLCLRCPALGAVAVLLCVLLAMAAALLGYMLSRNNVQLCTANIVLEYVQIVTLLSGPSIPWPEGVKGVLTSLSIFRLNLEVAAPECYSNIALTPSRKLVLVLAAPLLVLAVSLVTFAGLAAVKATSSAFSAYATTSSSLAVVVDEQWAVPLSGKKQTLSRRCLPSDSSAASADTWSHSASVCRATAKALGALYLPVVVSSLEVWNCTPTEPADGLLYLNVVFEPCGRSGGTQEQMKPWAIGGLALYGVLYPALLAWFFTKYDDLIVEDQLLCAAEVGDDVATNPRAYLLRQYFSPLYVDYRPGYHYASLATHARRALVSICALMLNKSPVLLSAAVAFVMAVSLAVVSTTRPLMSPGQGYASTLARFAAIASMHPNSHSHALQARIKGIAARTSVPALLRLSAGQVPSSDVASASCPWWSYPVADWNFLEAELQLQVLLTALLSVMYNAAQGSAYQVTASEAVTVVFFLLQAVAVCHICATVGYDLILQLRRAMQDLIDAADTPRGGEVNADAKCRNDSISTTNVTAGQLTFLCCCRCLLSHDRARALFRPQAATVDASRTITQRHTWAVSLQGLLGMRAGTPGAMVAPSLDAAPAWTANPIDSRGPRAEAVASPHDPQPTAPISPLSPSRHIRALALSTGMSPTGAGIMSAPESA